MEVFIIFVGPQKSSSSLQPYKIRKDKSWEQFLRDFTLRVAAHFLACSFQCKTVNIGLNKNNIYTPGTAGGPGGRDRTLAVKSRKNVRKITFFSWKKKIYQKKIFFFCVYLLVMPKYWVKNYFAHGSFPEVSQKQKTERRERKKEREKDWTMVITMAKLRMAHTSSSSFLNILKNMTPFKMTFNLSLTKEMCFLTLFIISSCFLQRRRCSWK